MFKFKILGITVQVKFLFIAIVTLFLLTDTTGLAIICLLSCILHELGHIFAFYIAKIKPNLLVFDITGIKLEQPKQQLNFLTELFILSSGSITNYIFALLGYLISPTSNMNFVLMNIIIGTLNLLPLRTFDGGKILFIILSCFFSDKLAYIFSITIDKITIVLLISLCVLSILAYELNFSYIIITLLLFISLFSNKTTKN